MKSSRLTMLAAPAVSIAYVLALFQAFPAAGEALYRPVAIAIGATVLMTLVAGMVLRNAAYTSLASTAAVLVSIGFWVIPVAVLAASALWTGWHSVRTTAAEGATQLAGRLATATAAISLALLAVTVVSTPWGDIAFNRAPETQPPQSSAAAYPDIFIVVLDAYPRSDVLARHFDYDNTWFHRELADRGFHIASAARSNYSSTWATFASMLNLRYLDAIPALTPHPEAALAQHRALTLAIRDATAISELHNHGYEITAVDSPFTGLTITSADRHVSTGQPTAFEIALIHKTAIASVVNAVAPGLLQELHRSGTIRAIDATVETGVRAATRPQAVFSHLLSPHAPYVFQQNGLPTTPPDCYPRTCTFWDGEGEDLPGQVHFLNRLMIDAVDRLIAARPTAVVVLMSDHGIATGDAATERLKILLAVRSPDRQSPIPDDASLVNLFGYLFNAYLGTDYEPVRYRGWLSEGDAPLNLTPAE